MLVLGMVEKFFLCSADTQTFISKFYSMLYEHWQNKFTDLQKSWSKNTGVDIDTVSWKNIIKLPVTISVCNRFREMQFYCMKCKNYLGTLFHCPWKCNKVEHFWLLICKVYL